MSDFFYLIKIGIVTLLFILLMQVHIGAVTVENHLLTFVKTSALTAPIREASEHGVVVVKGAYNSTVKFIDTKLFKRKYVNSAAGERSLLTLKRSDTFLNKEQKKKEEKEKLETQDKAEAGY